MRGTSGSEMAAVVGGGGGGLYADRTVGGGASFQNCSATKKIKKKYMVSLYILLIPLLKWTMIFLLIIDS